MGLEVNKLLWVSKTFWLNLIGALIGIGSIFVKIPPDALASFLPVFASAWGILGIVIRLLTKDKVVLVE